MTLPGMSAEWLGRLRETMAGFVERGEMPGLVYGIHRRGGTLVEAIGAQAFGAARPMSPDSIFRIASNTKPIVAAAALALVERSVLRLDDPVDRLLPELADRRVLRRPDGPLDDTVPADGPITLRHLLTSTMGLGQLLVSGDTHPIVAEAERLGVAPGPPIPRPAGTTDEWIERLGRLPLVAQPGTRWLYDTPLQVLGVLVGRAGGGTLAEVVREYVTGPAGMRDSAFSVSPGAADRLPALHDLRGDPPALTEIDPAGDGPMLAEPSFHDGAGGMVSTVGDLLTFGRMMLGGGSVDGVRILSRPTVAAMTSDQLVRSQRVGSAPFLDETGSRSWGWGLSVITARDQTHSVPGQFGWDGGFGTSWYADPVEGLTAVLLTQRAFGFPDIGHRDAFWAGVYAAIDD